MTPATFQGVASTRSSLVAIIAGYNVIQNRLLPGSLYVPANIVVSAALVAMARRNGSSWADLGLDPARTSNGLRLGAGFAGAVGLGTLLGASHPAVRSRLLDERAANQQAADVLYNILVRFPLGTALFEEVVFRGVVEAMWSRDGASGREGEVAAAVLFGLWHLVPTKDVLASNPATRELKSRTSKGAAVAAAAAVTGVASLGFSRLREWSGSLVAPWLGHTAISCAGYLAGVFVWRREVDRASA